MCKWRKYRQITNETYTKQEKADVHIVQLAALLHDVDDINLSPDTHAAKKNAVDFMTANKIDTETIDVVCKIIDELLFAGTDSVIPNTMEDQGWDYLFRNPTKLKKES